MVHFSSWQTPESFQKYSRLVTFLGIPRDQHENAYHLALTCSVSEASSLHAFFLLCNETCSKKTSSIWNSLGKRQTPFSACRNCREHLPSRRYLFHNSMSKPMHFVQLTCIWQGIGIVLVCLFDRLTISEWSLGGNFT